MQDPYLIEALLRLDRWLLALCDAEELRASRSVEGGGWEAVKLLARVGELDAPWVRGDAPELWPDLAGPHPVARFGRALGLHAWEVEALVVLLAPWIDPRYTTLYAVLQEDLTQRRPTDRLLLRSLGTTPERWRGLVATLAPGGPLLASGAVRVLEADADVPLGRTLALADDLRDLALGVQRPSVPRGATTRWLPGGGSGAPGPACQVIHGPGDRLAAAVELAAGHDDVFVVRLIGGLDATLEAARTAWRIGLATDALPLVETAELEPAHARLVAQHLESLLRPLGGRAWLLARGPLPIAVPHHGCREVAWLERRARWLAGAVAGGHALSDEAAGRLATAHRMPSGSIEQALELAEAPTEESIGAAARQFTHRAVRHARQVAPDRTFDDIVLREITYQALERLVHFARNRDIIAHARGLSRQHRLDRGPIVLFSGRPGTGKTLAAEIVASQLGRSLHVVDLSRLVSKYIGETEKHIDEVLVEASAAGAVLLFDEADALFSQRVDVATSNDRFANLEVAYLLQRIEQHDGLVLLATNLRASIDDAFLRRFQFRVEFPLPQPRERVEIWELMFPPGVPRAADVDLPALAEEHRFSGGEIRNAALKAIFLAEQAEAPVDQATIQRAIALELLELGRLARTTPAAVDRGVLVRAFEEALRAAIEAHLRACFLKEVHVLFGAPTRERLAGKRPAVSLTLHKLAGSALGPGVSLGIVVGAWSDRDDEEDELLGVVHAVIAEFDPGEIRGRPVSVRVHDSHDFNMLTQFWAGHSQPLRPAIVLDADIR